MERGTSTKLLERMRTMRFRESMSGYLMQLPALLVLATFVLIPIAASVGLSFTKYDLFSPPKWKGIANFQRLLTDKRLWQCFRNTVAVAFGAVVGNNLLGLLLAMGANRAMPRALKYFLRAALFFPVLTTASSLAMVWGFLFASDRGAMNWVIGQIGIEPIRWLNSSAWALRSVIMYQVWRSLGVTMVIYLAGLQRIPWRLTRHITLPLLTPSIFFSVVMGFVAGFQIYEGSVVLTGGGPGDASRTIAVYLYELAFRHYEMGHGAAVASVLLFLLVGLTMLQFWAGNRWVYYE